MYDVIYRCCLLGRNMRATLSEMDVSLAETHNLPKGLDPITFFQGAHGWLVEGTQHISTTKMRLLIAEVVIS